VLGDPVRAARALDYSARQGHAGLRAWAAEREGVDEGRVVLTNGALHALSLALLATVDPGDTVVVENPVYPLALSVIQLTGARVEPIGSDADGLDVDELERRIDEGLRPRAVYVVPDFHNPTGAILAASRRTRLVELAERHGFVVVSDNPYAPLRWRGERIADLDTASDRVIRANTFAKVHGPGLRLGWAVLPEWAVPGALALRARTDQHPSSLVQEVVADLVVRQGLFDEVAAAASGEYRRRADALVGALREGLGDAARVALPDGGLFAWLRLERVDADALAARLADQGVLVNPGSQFSSREHASPEVAKHVRMTFARHDVRTLRQAAAAIAEAHDELEGETR
jgi:2-aminoadipate transaminase